MGIGIEIMQPKHTNISTLSGSEWVGYGCSVPPWWYMRPRPGARGTPTHGAYGVQRSHGTSMSHDGGYHSTGGEHMDGSTHRRDYR